MKQITLIVALNFCIISFGQNPIIGNVSDESGPLLGANVVIKNTAIGVATDLEGNFEIKAYPTDTISFSSLDISQKISW